MSKNTFGRRLRDVRELRGLSLNELARRAKISAAYLQKLERDEVKNPSPPILHRLAHELKIPYKSLMDLAGYTPREKIRRKTTSALAYALNSEDLSEDEIEALSRYLAWYRHERQRG